MTKTSASTDRPTEESVALAVPPAPAPAHRTEEDREDDDRWSDLPCTD